METNEELKRQANRLLEAYDLKAHNAVVHGSFYLDLMVCPDIDAYISGIKDYLQGNGIQFV